MVSPTFVPSVRRISHPTNLMVIATVSSMAVSSYCLRRMMLSGARSLPPAPSPSPSASSLPPPPCRYSSSVPRNQRRANLDKTKKIDKLNNGSHPVPFKRKEDEIVKAQQTHKTYSRKSSPWKEDEIPKAQQTHKTYSRKSSPWKKWLLGSITVSILPYWQNKWQRIRQIEEEVETVAEKPEDAVEVVEKVASMTEKIASEVADHLPCEGKLKDAALFVEHVSEEVRRDAEIALEIIHEVAKRKRR